MQRAIASGVLIAGLTGFTALAPAAAAPVPGAVEHSAPGADLSLDPVGSHRTDIFDEGAAEIVVHYSARQQTLVVNAAAGTIRVLDSSDPAEPSELFELATGGIPSADGSTVPAGGTANSVDVREDGLAAVAVENPNKTDDGWVAFFDLSEDEPTALGAVRTGALPDSVVFSPDGAYAVVANEGEPAEDYSVDPEGTVGVIALPSTVEAPQQNAVRLAGFHAFEDDNLPEGVRVYGGREDAGTGDPEFPVSENLEPEYSAVIGSKAYVTLQEANAIAVVDLASAAVESLLPLGTQDLMNVPADVSNEDGSVNIANWPVETFFQPDTIKAVEIGGTEYLLTANEGDSRDWDAYSEELRVKDFGQDGVAPLCESVAEDFGMSVEELQADENLGRLTVTSAQGLAADGSCYEQIYGFGGRSFSILDTSGELVFNSEDEFEQITAEAAPEFFNSTNDESNFDNRSDDKGPEPEAVEVGRIGDRTFAFVGFERIGGIAVYDITRPAESEFVTYFNNRNFAVEDLSAGVADAGDSGPESVVFVPASELNTPAEGVAGMLIVGNEVTGSTTFYDVHSDLLAAEPSEPATPSEPADGSEGAPAEDDGEDAGAAPVPDDEAPSTVPGEKADSGSSDGADAAGDRPGALPRTGTDVGVIAGVGAVLAMIGAAAIWLARRSRG
ncbi:hypothetical protein GCM10022261_27360 [Brevibacterium daeguense]|uniref:Choice-of-anchor I domain-containing protein n=1 Tax=Brevibacterium daeguense TaxID=909936 RepID=A0ABP8EMN2_9MICO|nr:choice-of-anchor I family protein [Brevibacterium daeguense]